jgi:hypothetical protein
MYFEKLPKGVFVATASLTNQPSDLSPLSFSTA